MASSDSSTVSSELVPLDTPSPARVTAKGSADYIDAQYVEIRPRGLRDYLRVLRTHRWLAAACLAVGLTAATLYTLATPRLYTASTLLEVPRRSPIQLQLKDNVLAVEAYDRNVNGASSFLATQVSTLKSRDLADRVVREYHLARNPAFASGERAWFRIPSLRALLPVRLQGVAAADAPAPDSSFPAFLRPRSFTGDGDPSGADGLNAAEVAPALLDRYMSALEVQDVRGTDLIQVRFTTPSPELSAFLAAAHTQAYLKENQAAQVATDTSAMGFLERQLGQARERVEGATTALDEFAEQHPNVALNEEDKVVGEQITGLAKLLTEASGTRVAAQSRYEYVRKARFAPLAHFFDASPAIQQLRLALLDVRAQRATLGNRLGARHPQMVELDRQAVTLRAQLQGEVEQEVAAADGRYRAARLQEKQLQHRLARLEHSAVALRASSGRYDLLKGDLENARALHASLLKQQSETAVHSQLEAAQIRVIERAEVPVYPSSPNAKLNLALGALAGLGMALAAVFLRESLDTSVKSSDDIEDLLQIPTLAAIPHFTFARRGWLAALRRLPGDPHRGTDNGSDAPELVVLHEPRSPIAETFRSLRTAVLFSSAESPRLILCTSAEGNEGKTVTALNLAIAVADAGSRVLLVDADLRVPGCHRVLKVDAARGLSNYLIGEASLDSVIVDLDAPRLSFLPAGPVPPNPAELVGSARMREALAHLRERYDFVILDAPPILPVTDAVVLSRIADAVVLVVKGQHTPRDLVRRARDQLVQAGANLIGVVANGVNMEWGDRYTYQRYGVPRIETGSAQLGTVGAQC